MRLKRPFEPQSYLDEAMAREEAGDWGAAARNYEILLVRAFSRHREECRTSAIHNYARLLRRLLRDARADGELHVLARRRGTELAEMSQTASLEPADLHLEIHWNTDSTDIDLWVMEPEGEKCDYQHMATSAGGRLFWDTTDGYGPELYRRQNASGAFEILMHYYGNNSARWSVPSAVLLVSELSRHPGTSDAAPPDRSYRMRLLPATDAVVSLARIQIGEP